MKNKWTKLIIKLLVAGVVLWAVYRSSTWLDIWSDLSDLNNYYVVTFFLLMAVNTVLSAYKWKLLLKADGVRAPFLQLLSSYMIGAFFNLFMISNIGGDTYRVASMGKGKIVKSTASVLADRLSGFMALGIISGIFSVLGFSVLGHHIYIVFPLALVGMVVGIAVSLLAPHRARKLMLLFRLDRIPKVLPFFDALCASFASYRTRPGLIPRIMVISFLFQTLYVVAICVLSRALHLPIPLLDFFVFIPLISILEALPISFYGLGLRDAGYVFFFTQIELANARTHALSLAMLYVGFTVLYVLSGGILFLRRVYGPVKVKRAVIVDVVVSNVNTVPQPVTIGIMLRHMTDKGGITVYTDHIVRAMLKCDYVNHYVLLLADKTLVGRYKGPNVTEVLIESKNSLLGRLMWDQVRILRHLTRHHVDVVYNPKLSVPMLVTIPTVFTMPGLEQFAERRLYPWHDRTYVSIAMQFYCNKADRVLVMARVGQRDMKRYLKVPEEKMVVIPSSYNEKCQIVKSHAELERVRETYKLPAQYILFVGGITPLKNLPTLIRAFKLLKEQGVPHKLVLSGFRRWKFETDLELIQTLDLSREVVETGFVKDDDLASLYSMAACFVLPSYYEGFGIPILEAQACGCPVVTGNRGAMPEVAGEGGAMTFDPDSTTELAEAISKVLTDPILRSRLVEYGLQNCRRYSWDKSARDTIDVLVSAAHS